MFFVASQMMMGATLIRLPKITAKAEKSASENVVLVKPKLEKTNMDMAGRNVMSRP